MTNTLNGIVHSQMRTVEFFRSGRIPALSVESLFLTHSSFPRNPLIAETCFKAGYIDSWGIGIRKITETCSTQGLPTPLIEDVDGGIRVTLFSKSTPQVTPQVTPHVEKLVSVLSGEMSGAEIMAALGLKDRKHFIETFLQPALDQGLVEMTIPDKPRSGKQKYRVK